MAKRVESVLRFFNTRYDLISDQSYGWYNLEKTLNDEEIEKIKKLFYKKEKFKLLIIINGINKLRPQRAWFFPEYFRNATAFHDIYHHDGAFIFMSAVVPPDFAKEDAWQEKQRLFESTQELAAEADATYLILEK